MKRQSVEIDGSTLVVQPIGAGQEVGRSCVVLKYQGMCVMFDCGIHPAYSGMDSLPFFDAIDPSSVDLLLVSHFHLDHCAAVPYLLEKTGFKGRIFMTHPTRAIYKMLLSDFIRVSNYASEDVLFTEQDLTRSMDRIEQLNYHQQVQHNGLRFWCYNAGHVLGAAMFMVEIAGVRILYTGDFSRQEDRHLMAAETPSSFLHDACRRGGRCLIPVFALGRAQELLLILDEYWTLHPELQNIPIYYASSLAKKCMTFYKTFINMMNERIRSLLAISNPFMFKHISSLNVEEFDDLTPSVVMASPAMLQSGLSRELFEKWCGDKRNALIIPGYCVEGTLAKTLLTGDPNYITSTSGQQLPVRCSIHYISFSAHSDFLQTSEFIDSISPTSVILVHGDHNEMGRLRQSLSQKYEGRDMAITMPANCQTVELEFQAEKTAKLVGKLAVDPASTRRISGVLVRKDYAHRIMDPSELSTYTQLRTNLVHQKQTVPCTVPISVLKACLSEVYCDIDEFDCDGSPGLKVYEGKVMAVMSSTQKKVVELRWTADPVTDMVADSVLEVILHLEASPLAAQRYVEKHEDAADQFEQGVVRILRQRFGTAKLMKNDDATYVAVDVNDSISARVILPAMDVICDHDGMKQRIGKTLQWIQRSLGPIPVKPELSLKESTFDEGDCRKRQKGAAKMDVDDIHN